MTTAQDRGWGPGWPNCQTGKTAVVTVHGADFRLRREVGPLFAAFLDAFHRNVQRLDIDQVRDDWSYACRPVRGTEHDAHPVPSNHSWGLAVDLNATRHPLGKRGTFTPAQVRSIHTLLARPQFRHFRWGGDYHDRADEMHFEYVGSPADASADTARLPKPKPAPKPAPTMEDDDMATLVSADSHTVYLVWAGGMRHVTNPTAKGAEVAAGVTQPGVHTVTQDQLASLASERGFALPAA